MIEDYLRDFGLAKLARKPTMAIMDFVKEIYANAIEHKTMMSFVHGVPIPYISYYIANWYGLPNLSDDFEKYLNHIMEEGGRANIIQEVVIPGTQWTNRPNRIHGTSLVFPTNRL